MKVFHPKATPYLIALIMGILMSAVMSLAVTTFNTGIDSGLLMRWVSVWPIAACIAIPSVFILRPLVQGFVQRFLIKG